MGSNITDKLNSQQIESNLADSKEIFALLIDAVEDYAIFVLDPHGNIVTWNRGAERLKGYTPLEAIGSHFSRFYLPADLERNHPEFELALARKNGKYEEEGWRLRKDGTKFWANVVITALKDSSGELRGFGKVTRDLTARKSAEEELRQAYANLEKRIDERTLELRLAKERAEQAVKARDEFFSMASHELRTPLTSLKLQTQIRKRSISKGDFSDFAPEKLMDLCDDDERQIARLAFLVDNMLDVSRINSGNFELSLSRFDMNELASGALKRMEPVLKDSGIKSSLRTHSPVVGYWDYNRLEQVIANLLSNAAKYAPSNPVELAVAEKEGRVRICVKDSGKGIAKEHHQKIFDPFERIKDRGEISGLGLGLYISHRIVDAHGGRIWVESEPGYGTTFVIELPLEAQTLPKQKEQS